MTKYPKDETDKTYDTDKEDEKKVVEPTVFKFRSGGFFGFFQTKHEDVGKCGEGTKLTRELDEKTHKMMPVCVSKEEPSYVEKSSYENY